MIRRFAETAGNAVILGAWVVSSACTPQRPEPSPAAAPVVSSTRSIESLPARACSLPQGHFARYCKATSGEQPTADAKAGDLEAIERVYLEVFAIVTRHFAERAHDRLEACCASLSDDPIASEFCGAATALAEHEKDAAKLADTMPRTAARIEASNELDLSCHPFGTALERDPRPRTRSRSTSRASGNLRTRDSCR